MLGTRLLGDVEDHHPGALPRAVDTIRGQVRAAMAAKAELADEEVSAGEPALLLCRVRLAGGLLLSRVPPLPRDRRMSRIFDVDDGQYVAPKPGSVLVA
jgi:hypothetical protein